MGPRLSIRRVSECILTKIIETTSQSTKKTKRKQEERRSRWKIPEQTPVHMCSNMGCRLHLTLPFDLLLHPGTAGMVRMDGSPDRGVGELRLSISQSRQHVPTITLHEQRARSRSIGRSRRSQDVPGCAGDLMTARHQSGISERWAE